MAGLSRVIRAVVTSLVAQVTYSPHQRIGRHAPTEATLGTARPHTRQHFLSSVLFSFMSLANDVTPCIVCSQLKGEVITTWPSRGLGMRDRTRSSSQAAGVPDVVPYCRDTFLFVCFYFSLSAVIPRRSAQQAVHAHLEPDTGLNMLQQHRQSHGDMHHQQQRQQQRLFLALPTTAAPSDQLRLSRRRQLHHLYQQQQHLVRTSIN